MNKKTPVARMVPTQPVEKSSALQATIEGLEKERDFYFNKLRDIEVLVQAKGGQFWRSERLKQNIDVEGEQSLLKPFIQEIQTILYSTEDGFEVPAEQENVVPEEIF